MKMNIRKISIPLLILILPIAASIHPLYVKGNLNPAQTTNTFLVGVKDFAELDNFDHAGSGRVSGYSHLYAYNVLENLYRRNPINTSDTEPVPVLAESYEIAPNGTSLIVHLKENVTFHDGYPFNASSVKWNFDRTHNVSKAEVIHESWFYGPLDKFEPFFTAEWNLSWVPSGERWAYLNSCDVIDEFTVQINTNGGSSSPWDATGYAFVQFSPLTYKNYATEEIDTTEILVGTGPFKFVYHNPTYLEGKMIKNENYWGESGDIDEIIISIFNDESTMQSAFLTGQLDYILDPPNINAIESTADVNLVTGGITGAEDITCMNTMHVNKTIRESIAHAINYTAALNTLLEGRGVIGGGLIPRVNPNFNESIPRPYYNLTHSRKVLIDAGLAQGLDLDSTNEEWQTLTDTSPIQSIEYSHSNTWNTHAAIVLQACRLIGIEIIDTELPAGDIYTAVITPALRENLEMFTVTQYYGDPGTDLRMALFLYLESDEPLNYWFIENTELDSLVWYQYVVNDTELPSVINRIQEILEPEFLGIYWYHHRNYAGMVTEWEGFTGPDLNEFKLVEIASDPGPGPGDIPPIPGFPIVTTLIFSATSIISIVILTKRKKK